MADVSASDRDFLLHPLQGAQIAGKGGTRQALNGHLKSKGFNLEDTHMSAPAQIDGLMSVLATSFVLSCRTGEAGDIVK